MSKVFSLPIELFISVTPILILGMKINLIFFFAFHASYLLVPIA